MNNILDILKSVGAIITDDHFVYTSGKHGSVYIFKDALYPHTEKSSQVGELFARKYQNHKMDIVVAPALGGIILSQWTAYHLSQLKKREILGLYTEKDSRSDQVFTRGYDKLIKGKQILVIEDTTNTGGSVKKLVDSVRKTGGNVIAVAVMVNRNPQEVNAQMFDAPFSALADFPAEAYEEKDCALCKKSIPINTSVGHGKKFLEANNK